MSSTHLSLHYHIVFGTKNHEPMIQSTWCEDLHAYLGGIIRTADGIDESVGGVFDHVHLLIGLRATHRLADVLRKLRLIQRPCRGWRFFMSATGGLHHRLMSQDPFGDYADLEDRTQQAAFDPQTCTVCSG